LHLTYCIPKPGRHSGGFQVRSGKRGAGQTRFFADRKHGGKAAARAAAEAFLEAAKPYAPPPAKPTPSKRNKSGVLGVRVVRVKHSNNGMSYLTLVVSYKDAKSKHHITSISLNKWGVNDGIERAIKLRGLAGADADDARLQLVATCGKGT
jgi:hypothetical protein